MSGRTLALSGMLLSLAAASPALAGSAHGRSLPVTNLDALGAPAAPAPAPLHVPAHVSGLEPAPLPNPDVDGPHESVGIGPGLTPALFRVKSGFEGDGFAPYSTADHGLDERRAPAAGLNWVVPVK